jgi:hypothetical protein
VLARSWLIAPPGSATRAGGATIAFLESDRRDLPGADERNGDLARVEGCAWVGQRQGGGAVHAAVVVTSRGPCFLGSDSSRQNEQHRSRCLP